MKRRDLERRLVQAGFWLERIGSRHYLWTNGRERIALSKGSNTSPRTLKSFLVRVRKAEGLRT